MFAKSPKKLIIMNILDILKRYTDENHRLSQKEIQDILEREYDMTVERKAVKRNLMNLIEFGYNINYSESVNVAKFKAAIVERGTSVAELADAVGLSKSTLYRKISTGGDDFTIGEVLSITKALHLSADEGQQIFFAQNVAYDATVKE